MDVMTFALSAAIALGSTVPPPPAVGPDSRQLARIHGLGAIDAEVEQRFERALATIDRHCTESRVSEPGRSSIADIVVSATRRLQQQGKATALVTFAEAWAMAVEGLSSPRSQECVAVAASLVVMIEDAAD